MSKVLAKLLDDITSRRTFIGRASAQALALTTALFGFTKTASAGGCSLCLEPTSECEHECGYCYWCWPAGDRMCCECYLMESNCDGSNCDDVLWSCEEGPLAP